MAGDIESRVGATARRWCAVHVLVIVLPWLPTLSGAAASIDAGPVTGRITPCEKVEPPGVIRFQGRTFSEIPDIADPALRRANTLINSGCRPEAVALLDAYRLQQPENDQIYWLDARLALIEGDRDRARGILEWLLEQNPTFASAKVLAAHIATYDDRLDEAERLLDEAASESPDDLWLYLTRLRLQLVRVPDQTLLRELTAIVNSPQFPGNARSTAVHLIGRYPFAAEEWRAARWVELTYDSSMPLWAKAVNLAREVEEWRIARGEQPDHETARNLLMRYALDTSSGRRQLALSYLLEAATIASRPTTANAQLIEQAQAVLDNDLSSVQHYTVGRPHLAHLGSFLETNTAVEATDRHGRTALCNAIMLYDLDVFWNELDRGADVHQECDGRNLVDRILAMVTTRHVNERQTMLRALLNRGVAPESGFCRTSGQESCFETLGPILREYD